MLTHLADPTDFKGYLLDLISTEEDTLWHFDDLIQAPMAVQAALMQPPQLPHLGGKRLFPKVRILACTNRRQDRAGGNGFIEPLKQRFVVMSGAVQGCRQRS